MVNFQGYSWIPGLIHPLNFPYSDVNHLFMNIISSFGLLAYIQTRLATQVSSIAYRTQFWYREASRRLRYRPISSVCGLTVRIALPPLLPQHPADGVALVAAEPRPQTAVLQHAVLDPLPVRSLQPPDGRVQHVRVVLLPQHSVRRD